MIGAASQLITPTWSWPITGDEDVFAPAITVGVPLHRAVRGSELVRLADGTHTAMLEQLQVIADAIERFSARHVGAKVEMSGVS